MARLSKRKRKHPPDEKHQIGPFQFERYGRLTVQESHISELDMPEIRNHQINGYADTISEIEATIENILRIVDKLDPLDLLRSSYFFYAKSGIEKKSEADVTFEEGISKRMLDFIQSIIISLPWKHVQTVECTEEIFLKLFNEVKKLFNITSLYFHIGKSAIVSSLKATSGTYDELQTHSEMEWNFVTGKRYINHCKLLFEQLLLPHNSIFLELFGISAAEFLAGIEKLRYSLMNRAFESLFEMEEIRKATLPKLDEKHNADPDKTFAELLKEVLEEENLKEKGESLLDEIYGYGLFNVKRITNFPNILLEKMSMEAGLNSDFFLPGAASGWPLRKFPITEYPFLKVGNSFYCFDIINLMDHLYRVIQKIILTQRPSYKEEWNQRQEGASQNFTVQLLRKIYPKAIIYESNYYEWKTGKSQSLNWCENDILLINDDLLLITEIKGGAYTPTSPSSDFDSHLSSIGGLLLNPAKQARRTSDYLKSAEQVKIFDNTQSEKANLRFRDFRQVILCTISLDSLLTIFSQELELKFMKVQGADEPVWGMSIDDLIVYADILDDEIVFSHFAEQRTKALLSQNFVAEDELDYLGLYLNENHFTTYAEKLPSSSRPISWLGYRTPMDEYYAELLYPDLTPKKPSQNVPKRIREIIDLSKKLGTKNRLRLGSYLLDINGETRTKLHSAIGEVIKRQSLVKRILPFSSTGDVKITLFCITPSINSQLPTEQWLTEYTTGTLLNCGDDERLMLALYYDGHNNLYNILHRFISRKDLRPESMPYYLSLAKKYSSSKVETALRKGKIGRNDQCPCGSGKKYKNCHAAV